MCRIKVVIELSIVLALILTGCATKDDVLNNGIISTESLSSNERCEGSAGNASLLYSSRKVGMTGNEIIFAVNTDGRGTLNKCSKNGDNQHVLYEYKAGYISNINVSGNWIIFSLAETKNYYICKLKIDGSCFEKIYETRIEDMWVCDNRIYFSKYNKRGATGIFSMDMDGENAKMLFDKQNIWFQIYNRKIYCMDLGELSVEDDDVHLFQLNIGKGDSGFQKLTTFKKMSGRMDRLLLKGKDLYYLDEDDGRLYKTNIDNSDKTLLSKDVSEFCIQDNKIYCIQWADTEGEDTFCMLDLDGTYLKSICSGNLKGGYVFNGVLDGWAYFTSDLIKCINTK